MIQRIYHYLYYRTYEVISRTNKTSPELSSAGLLSIAVLINISTVYFFLFEISNKPFFIYFFSLAVLLSFLNLFYLRYSRCKLIILEFKNLKINWFYKSLIDSYFYLSFLFLLVSINASLSTILYYLGIIILLKIVDYFWNM